MFERYLIIISAISMGITLREFIVSWKYKYVYEPKMMSFVN